MQEPPALASHRTVCVCVCGRGGSVKLWQIFCIVFNKHSASRQERIIVALTSSPSRRCVENGFQMVYGFSRTLTLSLGGGGDGLMRRDYSQLRNVYKVCGCVCRCMRSNYSVSRAIYIHTTESWVTFPLEYYNCKLLPIRMYSVAHFSRPAIWVTLIITEIMAHYAHRLLM